VRQFWSYNDGVLHRGRRGIVRHGPLGGDGPGDSNRQFHLTIQISRNTSVAYGGAHCNYARETRMTRLGISSSTNAGSARPQRKPRRLLFFRDERGSSMIEYSLVFGLLMTMLLGIADFSRALYAYHYVSSSAREAARYASVRGTTCSVAPSSCTTANSASGTAGHTSQTDIQDFVNNGAPLGVNGALTATVTWSGTPNDGTVACTGANPAPGCVVKVKVAYNFNFMFPFVSKSTLTMNSTSRMSVVH